MKKAYRFGLAVLAAVVVLAAGFAACENATDRIDDVLNKTDTGAEDEGKGGTDAEDESGTDAETESDAIDTRIYFASEDYTVDVQPDTGNWSGTAWTLNATEANTVYFAVMKSAEYAIEVGGDDSGFVTQAETGTTVAEATEAGLAASAELAVFTVDTRDLVFDGGTRSFTLGDVEVTLNVLPNMTGAAVYTVARPEGQTYQDGDSEVTLTRIDTGDLALTGEDALSNALTWVEGNAVENNEYLIRVENAINNVQRRLLLMLNKAGNVTLRLRGSAGEEKKITWDKINKSAYLNVSKHSTTSAMGFINFGYAGTDNNGNTKKTFVLENNITIEGWSEQPLSSYFIIVGYNTTLVLRKGAAIKNYKASETIPIIINVKAATTSNNPAQAVKHGRLRIEGGSITGHSIENKDLIQFGAAKYYTPGAFYKAASTAENPIVISENTDNSVHFGTTDATPRINIGGTEEISLPE